MLSFCVIFSVSISAFALFAACRTLSTSSMDVKVCVLDVSDVNDFASMSCEAFSSVSFTSLNLPGWGLSSSVFSFESSSELTGATISWLIGTAIEVLSSISETLSMCSLDSSSKVNLREVFASFSASVS